MRKKLIVVIPLALLVAAAIYYQRSTDNRANPETFVIAFNQWVGFAPFFVAKEFDLYQQTDVELRFLDLEGDKRAGLESGRVDMVCETMDMFQTSRESKDFSGVIVFAVDKSNGGDGVVVSGEIETLSDLDGATVASEPGQPAHFILQYLLDTENITLKNVQLVNMKSADAGNAFIAGRVDAAATYEPFLTQALEKRDGAKVLLSSADLDNKIIDVCIVSRSTYENSRSRVADVANGFFDAVDFMNHDSAAVKAAANVFAMTVPEFNSTVSGLTYMDRSANSKYFSGSPSEAEKVYEEIGIILLSNEQTKTLDDPEERISFIFAD